MSDMHVLAGAFAAGALDDPERAQFALHLRSCAHCKVEVRELTETAALLGIAAAEPAPPTLRTAVLAEIARTRQIPPVVVSLAERSPRRATMRRFGLSAAACLAVLTIGLGAYANRLADENSDLRRSNDQIQALTSAADARAVTASGGGGTATVMLSAAANRMEFVSRGLLERPGRTYQLWLIGPDGPRSAGTFSTEAGKHEPMFFNGPGQATTLAVTEEPEGGSVRPTAKPVLVLDLAHA